MLAAASTDLGQLADVMITRVCVTKGFIRKGMALAAKGVIARGALACEKFGPETSLLFYSHATPTMVRPMPGPSNTRSRIAQRLSPQALNLLGISFFSTEAGQTIKSPFSLSIY